MPPADKSPASGLQTLIIGAGAAGLAAAAAAKPPALVLDHLPTPGRKILVSGGGRCNITRDEPLPSLIAAFGPAKRFVAPALHTFPPAAIRDRLATHGVPTHTEENGCVFPDSHKAAHILAALQRAAEENGATFQPNTRVKKLLIENQRCTGVETTDGEIIRAARIILAAGGSARPSLGSDGSGFSLARAAGLALIPPVPALTPLPTQETWPTRHAGASLENARLTILPILGKKDRNLPSIGKSALHDACDKKSAGSLLFTHHGLSGPAALNLSGTIARALHDGAGTVELHLSFCAGKNEAAWQTIFANVRQNDGSRNIAALLAQIIPSAVARTLCELAAVPEETPIARLSRTQVQTLIQHLTATPLHISKVDGFEKAMLTSGGVALAQVNPKTLECKTLPGLFLAGEILDVAGPCGGYNLTFALASGHLAAIS